MNFCRDSEHWDAGQWEIWRLEGEAARREEEEEDYPPPIDDRWGDYADTSYWSRW